MHDKQLKQTLEAAIFAADAPLSLDQLVGLLEVHQVSRARIKTSLENIAQDYAQRGVQLKKVASGYRFQTRDELGEVLAGLWQEKPPKYSQALLETLALIAYRQPITRGDIEEVRGVSVSSHIMKTLQERGWIKVVGQREVPGRPQLYATTASFLDYFNVSDLSELPQIPAAAVAELPTMPNMDAQESDTAAETTAEIATEKRVH